MKYAIHTSLSGEQLIVRTEDKAFIPTDPSNTDYQAYLEWVAEGNTAEEWEG